MYIGTSFEFDLIEIATVLIGNLKEDQSQRNENPIIGCECLLFTKLGKN